MKNLFNKLCILLFIAHFIACSHDAVDEMSVFTEDGTVVNTFKVSENEARETLMSFLDRFDTSSSGGARSTSQKTIKDIQAFNVNPMTRASSDDGYELPEDLETLFYLINFNDNQGFGIVSGDKRTTPVLAIIDEGGLSLDTLSRVDNPGFLMFLDQVVVMQLNEIAEYDSQTGARPLPVSPETRATPGDVSPRLQTKWSQGAPYNKFAPNGVTGCVITAAAQALSYFQTIGHVQWQYQNTYGASPLNWSQIIADSEDYLGGYGRLHRTALEHAQSADQVSHLMRYLGVTLKATYNKGNKKEGPSTSADSGDAIKHLKNWCGLSSSTSLRDYNADGVRVALQHNPNSLVWARGNGNRTNKFLGMIYTYKDGHAWIIDGIRIIGSTDYVHCNWGWGGKCDGYFVSGSFNTQAPPAFLDPIDDDPGTEPYNYRYKKQYAVLSR